MPLPSSLQDNLGPYPKGPRYSYWGGGDDETDGGIVCDRKAKGWGIAAEGRAGFGKPLFIKESTA